MINQRFGVFLHLYSQVQYKHNEIAKNPNNKTKGKMSSKIMQVLHIPLTMVLQRKTTGQYRLSPRPVLAKH